MEDSLFIQNGIILKYGAYKAKFDEFTTVITINGREILSIPTERIIFESDNAWTTMIVTKGPTIDLMPQSIEKIIIGDDLVQIEVKEWTN